MVNVGYLLNRFDESFPPWAPDVMQVSRESDNSIRVSVKNGTVYEFGEKDGSIFLKTLIHRPEVRR